LLWNRLEKSHQVRLLKQRYPLPDELKMSFSVMDWLSSPGCWHEPDSIIKLANGFVLNFGTCDSREKFPPVFPFSQPGCIYSLKKQPMETPVEYVNFFAEVKTRIRSAQYEALKAVNKELVDLYWDLGKMISEKQKEKGWGKSVVVNLARELQQEFPGMKGFSEANLWYMAQFYSEYQGYTKLESMIREIGWTHNLTILKKCKNASERIFYVEGTVKFGWTTRVLEQQIGNRTYEKYLLNQTNFDQISSDVFQKQKKLAVKDHYTFDFLELSEEHSEHQLETGLMKNIRAFLLELGGDFCFIGNQYRLVLEDEEYFIDLLLYHRRLQCLVAIELKTGDFKPEFKGKMEFYLNILNDKVKVPNENDAIGIIICRNKKRLVVEYSLRNSMLPIGVASYSTTNILPEYYSHFLPDSEQMARSIDQWISSNNEY
jgi:predicted nuclease of restriction endonuclease-like (RecB) superfamily